MSPDRSEKYSLWLMPGGERRERLYGLIRKLATRYDSPLFEPHLTLLGGIVSPENEAIEKARELASSLEPFIIELAGVGYLNEYYRCLFMKAKETEALMRANEKAREVFSHLDDQPFMPHLSLLYGSMKTSRKRKIISSIAGDISDLSFGAASLHVYSTEGGPSDWFEVEEVSLGE